MDERIDTIHSELKELGFGDIKRKNLDRTINHITKTHFDFIREITEKVTKSMDDLTEIMVVMDIKRPGRFVTYLALIANANISELETKLLVRKLVDSSDPAIVPGVRDLVFRIARIDERSYWHQCVI